MPACWPKEDGILYVHVHNIKFLFESLEFWVSQAHETTNQVEVALAKCTHMHARTCACTRTHTHAHIITQITPYC